MSASGSAPGLRPLPSAQKRPVVIAHRGASAHAPENTHPAYRLAVEMAADMIEIDLHRTRDGRIAISHDAELEGLGGGEIADHDFARLQELDAGGGERVPELADVLDRYGSAIPFNLEIKAASRGVYQGLEAAALDVVRTRGLLDRVLFSSFEDEVLAELRRLEPGARLAVLASWKNPAGGVLFRRAEAVGAEAVNPFRAHASPVLIAEAHARGLAVYPYTVDDSDEMAQLLRARVDGMFTNHPDRLLSLLGRRN